MNQNEDSRMKQLDAYLDSKFHGSKFPAVAIAIVICIGAVLNFGHNASPAPFLDIIIGLFNLDPVLQQSLVNLTISIMFVGAIPGALIGPAWETKFGTWSLMLFSLVFCAAGVLMVFFSSFGIWMFMAGRVVYGFGFGLIIPAIGSAMMKWFRPRGRALMATMNGFFPLCGALIGYALYPFVASLFHGENNWEIGFGFSGFVTVLCILAWVFVIRKRVETVNFSAEETRLDGVAEEKTAGNPLLWVAKSRDMWCITVCFIADFCMYMYIATVLPVWLVSAGGIAMGRANTLTAIAFPLFGIIGTIIGASLTNVLGRRKPIVLFGQILKLVGILVACFGADSGYYMILVGAALFGLGNGGWMPPLYMIPTEIPGTNASRTAAGYSFFNVFGWVAGCLSPALGGIIAVAMIRGSEIVGEQAQLAYGYKWSMLILGMTHIAAIIAALLLRETGPGRNKGK